MLLRKSLQSLDSLASGEGRCSECRRFPLPGERLHELDTGRILCELCLGALPEKKRRPVRSERVRASDRPLAVVQRAA
jgi:hypothetical protein